MGSAGHKSEWECLRHGLIIKLTRYMEELLFEETGDKKPDIRRAFRQAAHKIGIPVRPEGDVDPYRIAFPGKLLLQITADAIQHLEFETGFWQAHFLGVGTRKSDPFFVVGRNGGDGWDTPVSAEQCCVRQ